MKIKTIIEGFNWPGDFDNKINEAMDEGWQLVRREVIPGSPNDSNKLYAELVLPDPPAEPETFDPIKALHQIVAACDAQDDCGHCPLYAWCCGLPHWEDPTDWVLPDVED